MMKLGCNTVLFNKLDLDGALQHIAWAGYDGAELACLGDMARHIEVDRDQSYYDEIKDKAKIYGLELFAIEAATNILEEERRRWLVKVFEAAKRTGIPVVAIGSGGKTGDGDVTQKVLRYIQELGEQAESSDITLAVKPHVGASVYNAETVTMMLERVDSPAVGVNFDPSHLYRAQDDLAEAVAKIGGERIVHSHFRDCPHRERPPGLPEQQVPGRGEIDIPRTLRALTDAGYDKVLDLEVIGAFTYPLSRQMGIAAEARGYLHRCLKELRLK